MESKTWHLILPYILMYEQFASALLGPGVRESQPGEFPSAVPILRIHHDGRPPELSMACTGALISNRDVLSSSHCLANEQLSNIKVLLGSNDLRNGIEYMPSWWLTYDEWIEEQETQPAYRNNDLCIIRLRDNVTELVANPIPMRAVPRSRLEGAQVEVMGWGRMDSDQVPRIGQVAALTVLNSSACTARLRRLRSRTVVPENNLCTAADPHAIVYHGDSGGPLYLNKRYLVGVTRGACPNATPLSPLTVNLHVYLYYYLDYISSVVFTYA